MEMRNGNSVALESFVIRFEKFIILYLFYYIYYIFNLSFLYTFYVFLLFIMFHYISITFYIFIYFPTFNEQFPRQRMLGKKIYAPG